MKRVRKSAEPRELREYKQRWANKPSPPKWNEFKKGRGNATAVKDQLRSDQGGLCAYCEKKLVHNAESVEHFVARSADTNRELDWTNLLLCCDGGEKPLPEDLEDSISSQNPGRSRKSCGHAKLANPASILNPLNLPAFPCLFRYKSETGEIGVDEVQC